MPRISLVVFDLAGTTVHDDDFVTRCLYEGARQVGLATSCAEIGRNIGTNKRHLYRWLIARGRGADLLLEQMGTARLDDAGERLADEAFRRYEQEMIALYRSECREVDGTSATFAWLKERGIKVATDTGFHKSINEAVHDRLGWRAQGLVDLAVDVQDVPGERGRPAPYMLFLAMQRLGIESVHEVVKVGDQPADLLEGHNAGCRGVIGVLSGSMTAKELGGYWHTHLIPSVADLPALMERAFL
jgi:phosphonatase-like hydrolase